MTIIVYGRNAVTASIESGSAVRLLTLRRLENDAISLLAKKKGVHIEIVDEGLLLKMAKNPAHQGFVVVAEAKKTISLPSMIEKTKGKKNSLILMLDGIEDPQNLGAILRSADAFGVDWIIMKSRGEAPLNGTVAKVSTGAIEYVDVSIVPNLSNAIKLLKDAGYWVVASDGSAKQTYDEVNYDCPIVLVIGSEGFGISRLVLQNSDFIIKIPMFGHVNSLNASVATGILLSAINRLRKPLP